MKNLENVGKSGSQKIELWTISGVPATEQGHVGPEWTVGWLGLYCTHSCSSDGDRFAGNKTGGEIGWAGPMVGWSPPGPALDSGLCSSLPKLRG